MAQTKIKAGLFEGIIGNGTDGYFLMSNGDGTMTWASAISNPTITSIAYPGSVTAADPAGGETITVTGTSFKTGATVTIGGTAAPAVSYVSETQITFTTPAKAAGDYDIVITNTDTGSATYINGISYNGIPTWTTAAGSLGTFASGATISTITLQATEPDAGTITFSITNGALPTGLSLTGANIGGTTSLETADTLYTFTVTATDDESQATPRTFTITVTKQFIGTENFTINTYTGNGSTQSIEGKIGTAADFNNSNSYITLPSSLNLLTTTYSFSAWINLSSLSDLNFIATKYNGAGSLSFWQFYVETSGGNSFLRYASYDSSGNGVDVDGTTNLSTNTWYHVAFTIDGSTVKIYLNGAQDNTSTTGYTPNTTDNDTKIVIGGRQNYSSGSAIMDGKIDQVRIFNKTLSSSEVTTLYSENNTSTTKSTTDIFDDGSGVALYEFEKGAKDTGGVNGYIGAGGIFDGSSSLITVSNSVNNTSTISVSCWFKTSYTGATQVLFNNGGGNSGQTGIYLVVKSGTGVLRFITSQGGTNVPVEGTTNVADGNWHHIAMSYNSGTLNIYLDGNTTPEVSSTTLNFTATATQSFIIGKFAGSAIEYFNGSIDQVRIFNKALSSSEATTLYNETSASATKSTTDIFDDGSGVALYEFEGNANDTGRGAIDSGQSAVFNGSKIILSNYAVGDWNTGTKSISFWAKFSSFTDDHMIYTETNTSYLRGYINILLLTNKEFRIQYHQTNGAANNRTMFSASLTSIVADNWYHFAIVGNDSSTSLYLNGVSQTFTKSTGLNSSNSNTDLAGKFGEWNSNGSSPFNGNLDDFRVYSDGLTSTEVDYLASNDATNISTINNLIAYYKFDGNATDSQGSNNGTATSITYSSPAELPVYNGTATNVSYAYDGTPTNMGFVGTSFQPDLVLTKSRSFAEKMNVFDSVRGATKRIYTSVTHAEATQANSLTSFNSNGWSIGAWTDSNTNNETFVSYAFKGGGVPTPNNNTQGTITSTVSANQDAGFSIVSYTGTAANATVGHGLTSAPEFWITKSRNTTDYWCAGLASLGGNSYFDFHLPDQAYTSGTPWNSTLPTSSVVHLGSYTGSNASNAMIMYCFHSVDGYQKVGTYQGNGQAVGNKTTLGFQPRFLLVKRTNGTGHWTLYDSIRSPSNTRDEILWSSLTNLEQTKASDGIDFLSDGFQPNGTSVSDVNASSSTYLYLAIA